MNKEDYYKSLIASTIDCQNIKTDIQDRDILIYGAYPGGKVLLDWLNKSHLTVAGFIDAKKSGQIYEGLKVCQPSVLDRSQYYVIVAVNGLIPEIIENLKRNNYQELSDYIYPFSKIPIVRVSYLNADYNDDYGNRIHVSDDFYGDIQLKGWNNSVDIGYGITPDTLRLTLEGGSTVRVGDYFKSDDSLTVRINAMQGATIELGRRCYIESNSQVFSRGGIISIGDNFEAGDGLYILNDDNSICQIENDCMLSRCISILSCDGHPIFSSEADSDQRNFVRIHEHCWLGAGVYIIHDSEIMEGCIVGAGSVVKGVFEKNKILAGNPAVVVRNDVFWDKHG